MKENSFTTALGKISNLYTVTPIIPYANDLFVVGCTNGVAYN